MYSTHRNFSSYKNHHLHAVNVKNLGQNVHSVGQLETDCTDKASMSALHTVLDTGKLLTR